MSCRDSWGVKVKSLSSLRLFETPWTDYSLPKGAKREPGTPQVGCGQPLRGTPLGKGPSEAADVPVLNLDVGAR